MKRKIVFENTLDWHMPTEFPTFFPSSLSLDTNLQVEEEGNAGPVDDAQIIQDDTPKSVGLSIPLNKDATVSEIEGITSFGNLETLTVDGSIGNRYDTLLSVNLGLLMAIPDYEKIVLDYTSLKLMGIIVAPSKPH